MLNSIKKRTITPAKMSDIDSRSECNPYYENEYKCTRGLELLKKANISVYKKQDNMWILI